MFDLFVENQFFYNQVYLNKWRKAGKRKRSEMPGHNYFSTVEKDIERHCKSGELYNEFRRFSCQSENCQLCGDRAAAMQNLDPVPQPFPNEETGHYKTFDNTPIYKENGDIRDTDDFQPRKQCDLMFSKGQITLEDTSKVKEFAKKFLVKEHLVKDFLSHKATLKVGKEMRSRERQRKKQEKASGTNPDESESDNQSDSDTESTSADESDTENDVLLNVIDDSDSEDESTVTFVPTFKTVTRHGRVAGTWRSFMNQSQESAHESQDQGSSESDSDVSDQEGSTHDSDSENSESQVSDSDESTTEESETETAMVPVVAHGVTVTRSGRRAGTWNKFTMNN